MFQNQLTLENILIDYEYNKHNSNYINNSIIMSLDMEKAFDRVSHKYLFKLKRKMRIGDKIIRITELIYKNLYQVVATYMGQTE